MSKFSVGRVMNAVVAVMAAHNSAKLSAKAIGEIVGISEVAVESWVSKRNVPDGSYLDIIEEKLIPMVKAHIDAKRMEILADLGNEYGERVKNTIARSGYGTAKAAAATRRICFERRGTKFTVETLTKKKELKKKALWIAAELANQTHVEIAERMGIQGGTFSTWVRGDNLPATTFGPKIESLYNQLKAEKKEMLKAAGVKQPEAPKPVAPPAPAPVVIPPPAPKLIDPIHLPSAMIRINENGASIKARAGTTLLIEDGEYLDLQELGTHTFRLTLPGNMSVRITK